MEGITVPLAVAFITAILGPVIAYFLGRRTSSGQIEASEAEDLWDASSVLLDHYKSEVARWQKLYEDLVNKTSNQE